MSQSYQREGKILADSGYAVTPIAPPDCDMHNAGKIPSIYSRGRWTPMKQWLGRPEWTRVSLSWPDCGVGIITGSVIGIDVDVVHEESNKVIRGMVLEHFGEGIMARVGGAPKFLLLMRNGSGADAIPSKMFSKSYKFSEDGPIERVEVLSDGQQFVAYGTHTSGQPYRWFKTGGGLELIDGPISVAAEDLPAVSIRQIKQFLDESGEVLKNHGGKQHGRSGGGRKASERIYERDELFAPDFLSVVRVLAVISVGGAGDRDMRVAMAHKLVGALGKNEDCFDVFCKWARDGLPILREDDLRTVWESVQADKTGVGWPHLLDDYQRAGFNIMDLLRNELSFEDLMRAKQELEGETSADG